MNTNIQNKSEIEELLKNSTWENTELGLIYDFRNDNNLWINGNAPFSYKIDLREEKFVLEFFPNGKEFFIEYKYGNELWLHDNKQSFNLKRRHNL